MVLRGLEGQTAPPASFEVIVVLDGSTDGSAALVAAWQVAGRLACLRLHVQLNQGQAAARNAGAELAASPLLIFLDDDVVPGPELVEAHLRRYAGGGLVAVLGEARVVRERLDSLYHLYVWAWWEDFYQTRSLPGRVPGLRDLCSGNFSVRRQDFLEVGGFDPAFRGYGGEDFELGYRLLRAGVQLLSEREAQARHYHRTTVEGVLRATRQEAHGDVLIGQKHPELRRGLRLMSLPGGRYGLLVRLALRLPALGDPLMRLLRSALPLLERLQLRRKWLALFNHLRGYAYWRGVREAFGSYPALLAYQTGAPPLQRLSLDITGGLPPDLSWLDVDNPTLLDVFYAGQRLGPLLVPGPILGPLRPYLARQLVLQLGPQVWQALSRPGAPLEPAKDGGGSYPDNEAWPLVKEEL
jgi:GT2 family glycosyltransferase